MALLVGLVAANGGARLVYLVLNPEVAQAIEDADNGVTTAPETPAAVAPAPETPAPASAPPSAPVTAPPSSPPSVPVSAAPRP